MNKVNCKVNCDNLDEIADVLCALHVLPPRFKITNLYVTPILT